MPVEPSLQQSRHDTRAVFKLMGLSPQEACQILAEHHTTSVREEEETWHWDFLRALFAGCEENVTGIHDSETHAAERRRS